MKTINLNITLFNYNQLNNNAKIKAYNEHEDFLISIDELKDVSSNIKEYIENSIIINEYLFFEDGTLADCTTYAGNHQFSGQTEFKFMGKSYFLTKWWRLKNEL